MNKNRVHLSLGLVALCAVVLLTGVLLWNAARAQNIGGDPAAGGAAVVDDAAAQESIALPTDTLEREVIGVENNAVDVSGGVQLGPNRPTSLPGSQSQPLPKFSGISAPLWVSEQGPAQVVDDLVVHGLTELRGGLINNGRMANGNIAEAAGPRLTFRRNPVPAPGSTLSTGTNTVLEFDAIPSQSVQMNRLALTAKLVGEAQNKVLNVKLKNKAGAVLGNGLASIADGRVLITFDLSASPQTITTAGARFIVTADLDCGNGGLDFVIEQAGDVGLVNPPAGLQLAGLPLPAAPRLLALCGPNVSLYCSAEGKFHADIDWNTYGKGVNGFYVDIDDETVISSSFKTSDEGGKGFWNAGVSGTADAFTGLFKNNLAAPSSFGNYGGALGALSLIAEKTYLARVYYVDTGEHSLSTSFTLPASCNGIPALPAEFNPGMASVLNASAGPGAAPKKTISLFGSFIPAARAQVAQPAAAQPLHPVHVFDDFYVYGNGDGGAEPGNIFVKGGLLTQGDSYIGDDAADTTQFTGSVSVVGGTLSTGALAVNGPLTAANGITVSNGAVAANDIGAFYLRTVKLVTQGVVANLSVATDCGTEDILVSCSGSFEQVTDDVKFFGTAIEERIGLMKCVAKGKQSVAGTPRTLNVQAVCFNSNRNASKQAGAIDL